MRTKFFAGVAFAALIMPGAAFAQSTGSTDFDEGDDIVVTARTERGVAGVEVPSGSKNRAVLNQEFISRQTAGQSINEIINNLPGVSFQNNDPFGSAGGTLTIRGFDGSRISQTFDGVPLNDTGNYAIYSNQQLDPELIEQVNVNLGSTDVDSPTAAASGSTVNYRSLTPTDEFGARLLGSAGDYKFFRIFGLINTGEFTSFGTKAWFSASHAENDVVFNDFGKIDKQQYNAKVYQPLGGTDFISISGNYNQNRNNFFGSAPLRTDSNVFTSVSTGTVNGVVATNANPILVTGAVRTAGTSATNRFPISRDELPYSIARCQVDTPQGGVADAPAIVSAPGASNNGVGCGTSFDERYNPSNTGNVRVSSKFSLGDKLTLYVDPSYQYVKANGGGTVTARENGFTRAASTGLAAITTPQFGFIGGQYYAGKDINGDGDVLDTVTYLAPSQTQTHRYGVISSLRYELSDTQSIRLAYSFDYGRHRQTGELAPLKLNGFPTDVFPSNSPLVAVNSFVIQKRDRLSYATLNQFAAQYRGEFGGLTIDAGLRAPFFKRTLNNYCFATNATGNVDCLGSGNDAANAAYAAASPQAFNATTGLPTTGYAAPQRRVFKYDKLLPSGGLTYDIDSNLTVFGSYSKGLQVPGTDNLYNSFYYALGSAQARPTPETTDNIDTGIRYTSSRIQAQIGPWYTRFTNRLASAFDPETSTSVYRNLGTVTKYGIDGSLAVKPIREVSLYVFGSYLKSKIKNDVQIGNCTTTTTVNCSTVGAPIFAATAGKRESGSPVYTFGGRIQGDLGPLSLAAQVKRTGKRYLNDQNIGQIACTVALVNTICPTTVNTTGTTTAYTAARGFAISTFGASAPAYTTVDLDARLSLKFIGLNDKTYFQFNVQNVFDKFYVGGFSGGQTLNTAVPFVQIGSPRALIGSINMQF